jgi:hypothetical protein
MSCLITTVAAKTLEMVIIRHPSAARRATKGKFQLHLDTNVRLLLICHSLSICCQTNFRPEAFEQQDSVKLFPQCPQPEHRDMRQACVYKQLESYV